MKKNRIPTAPKSPKAPKNNVLGQLGRNQLPTGATKPDSVVGEFAREQDSPLDKFTPPKARK